MPNWCAFDACIYGDKREVEAFRERCVLAMDKAKETNHWDTWELCMQHDVSKTEIDNGVVDFVGGSIDDLGDVTDESESRSYLMVHMTTRWRPMIEGFNALLKRGYLSLQGVYLGEEPGCGIYVNTDLEGRYFSVRYAIEDCDWGGEWFDTIDELKKYVKKYYKYNLTEIRIAKLEKLRCMEVYYDKNDNSKSFYIAAYN